MGKRSRPYRFFEHGPFRPGLQFCDDDSFEAPFIYRRLFRELSDVHRGIGLIWGKNILDSGLGKERALFAESRGLRERIESKIPSLELPFPQVAPFGKCDCLTVLQTHRKRIAMDDVLFQNEEGSFNEIV
jgi:hypothetical protein